MIYNFGERNENDLEKGRTNSYRYLEPQRIRLSPGHQKPFVEYHGDAMVGRGHS
jgi:hypothetical protein